MYGWFILGIGYIDIHFSKYSQTIFKRAFTNFHSYHQFTKLLFHMFADMIG